MAPSKTTENFLVENDGPITTITFNRPERRNCLDEGVILDFERHLHAVRDDRECRVLIVTGKGSAFCAGADHGDVQGSGWRRLSIPPSDADAWASSANDGRG